MAYNVEVKKNMALSRAKVFAALTDFGGVAKILPDAIKSCELVGSGIGSVRNIVLTDGGKALFSTIEYANTLWS